MKIIKIVLVVLVLVVVCVVLFPKVYQKDSIEYEAAVAKWAKGKFVTVDNKKIHDLEKGEGKPVILIHGFLYHTIMWKKIQSLCALKVPSHPLP